MEIATTTEFQLIYPGLRDAQASGRCPRASMTALHALAAEDAVANRIQDAGDGRNVGDQTNHLGHLRHNFLMDRRDPAIAVLAQMVAAGVREYLQLAYGYDHSGDIRMMSDTFWQRRAARENVGINAHTHIQTDIVCTYYPRVVLDADCPEDLAPSRGCALLRSGQCRQAALALSQPGRLCRRLVCGRAAHGLDARLRGPCAPRQHLFRGRGADVHPGPLLARHFRIPTARPGSPRSWPIRRKEAAMAYKVGTTIVIDDSGNVDWSRIANKPAIGTGDITRYL